MVAAALTFVAIFELAAWSFFLNGLFVGDMLGGHWLATPAALALAAIFAGTILFFERQVVIADFPTLAWWRKAAAMVVRVLSILVAGAIVAHAVDLLAFADPIDRRLHSEQVQREERRLQADLDRLRALQPAAQRSATTARELERVRDEIGRIETRQQQALADQRRYQAQEVALRDHPEIRRAESDGGGGVSAEDRAEARRRQRRLTEVRGERAAADETVRVTTDKLSELRQVEEDLIARGGAIDVDTERHQWIVQLLEGRLARWIASLEKADPGPRHEQGWEAPAHITAEERARWEPEWQERFSFAEPKWSFFEKVDALWGIVGESWRALRHPSPADQLLARGQWVRSPLTYFSAFVGIHLAAMFVPFLVFFIKWLFMSKEVNDYFSVRHQAHAGDAEAQLMLNVEAAVRRSEVSSPSTTPRRGEDARRG